MSVLHKEHKKFDAIVCLSAIDWDFLWQRTQEVMSQFAAMGYPVLFIENTGVRVPGLRDIPRIRHRIKKLFQKKDYKKQEQYVNIEMLSPFALPFPYSPIAVQLNAAMLRKKILRFSSEKKIPVNRILLWSYMTTPLAVKLADMLPWAGVVVDLVSDPCKVKGAADIVVSHKKMLESADIIYCASVPVVNSAKKYILEAQYHKVQLFEDGFSTRLYNMASHECEEINFPRKDTGGPLVAYIGGVNDKIWWDAVSTMARKLPEITFLYVGPKDVSDLPCEGVGKNVFWSPSFKEYCQLGLFLDKCSAGLIPYTPNPYVAEMRPAKINEYLVMGLPIVATKLPEIERFANENGPGIIYLAETADDFPTALEKALDEDCEEYRNKRWEIARSRSWETICKGLELHLQGLM
ncbi:MAG: glycosyltransferase [Clostridia bacterium]|nr:glycosyltransferase [Clostridia bacterium]